MENFAYAESSMYFQKQQDRFPINEWQHVRQMADVAHQDVIRMNADTAYSIAIVDVSEGATVSLPRSDAYQSIQVIDLNHYTPHVIYPGDSLRLTTGDLTVGSHAYLFMRTSEEDMHARQDAAVIDANSAEPFVSEHFNPEQLDELRAQLIARTAGLQERSHLAFGPKEAVDPEVHLAASAVGWAGLPAGHAMYLPDLPNQDRSGAPSAITFRAPDLAYEKGGFWSLTAYGADGWIKTENFAINSKNAVPNPDGSYTVHFNSPGRPNNLDVVEGYWVTLRMYRPRSVDQTRAYMLDLIRTKAIGSVTATTPYTPKG
jgi:hypothetical protein